MHQELQVFDDANPGDAGPVEVAADDPPPVVDETDPAATVDSLPLTARFRLGADITPLQHAFLARHGFVVYDRVASLAEVAGLREDIHRVQAQLLADDTRSINGVPIWFGEDPDGKPFLQRLAFSSLFSDVVARFIRDPRLEPVRTLVGDDARLGDQEKDGVVLNRYVRSAGSMRKGLGWHTDGLRDVFYNWRMPLPQLNVGLHLDRIRPDDGGLRLIPGSQAQGVWSLLFRKPYFVSHAPDPAEVAVETWPGDLTVHDGRMWHRVAPSPHEGWASLRTSMYVPYVKDAYQPKSADTPTLWYMRVFDAAMRARSRFVRGS